MGNYRFKFSDMIPNAWFYKLKDTSTTKTKTKTPKTHQTKKKHQPPPPPPPITTSTSLSFSSPSSTSSLPFAPPNSQRKSYYFTRNLTSPDPKFQTHPSPITPLPDPPRKSSKKRRSTKRSSIHHRKSSPSLVSTGSICRAGVWTKPDRKTPDPYPNSNSGSENESLLPQFESDRGSFDNMVSSLSCQQCRLKNDDVDYPIVSSDEKLQKIDLRPIITKSSTKFEERNAYGSLSVKVVKQELQRRRFPANSPVKLRAKSPRIMTGSRVRVQLNNARRSVSLNTTSTSSGRSRRSLSESFAVVKSSVDPQRDFKESMVEMIMENNIKGSKDLEELLACYLFLNSDEYHELIIKVFKQIWFDISDIRFK